MKKIILFLLRAGISMAILYFIFHNTVSLDKVSEHLRNIDRGSIIFAGFGYGIIIFLGIIRWKILLNAHKIRISLAKTASLSFIGYFFNNFLPSITGGDVAKAYYVSKETDKRTEAVSTVIVDRMIGLLALFLLGTIAGLTRFSTQEELRMPILTIFAVFLATFLCIAITFNKKLYNYNISSSTKGKKLLMLIKKIHSAFHYYRNCPGTLIAAFILSLLLQTIILTINYQLARGLGVKGVELTSFFIFIPLATAISVIPITFGGWGLREKAYEKCLLFVNISPEISISLSIALGLITACWSMVGLPIYLFHRAPKQKEGT